MINYDSILSAFDGKPTLLQWLKLVKKALDESVLKDITVSQDGTSAVFTFNFEDGTSISTPAVTLPKGNTGAKGDKGDTGVSVTGVDEVSNEVVGTQTLTTLRFNFSNGTNNEVTVHAENGKNAGGEKYYEHNIYSGATNGVELISIKLINSSATPLTIETISANNIKGFVNGNLYNERDMLFFPITNIEVKNGQLKVRYIGTNFSENYQTFTLTPFGVTPFDRVTEL